MILNLINQFTGSSFLKDSTKIFVVNIIVSVLNFALQPIASNTLENNFAIWSSLTSLITIFLTLISGLGPEIARIVSTVDNSSDTSKTYEYYKWLRSKFLVLSCILLVLTPILAYILNTLTGIQDYFVVFITTLYFSVLILVTSSRSFLLGKLDLSFYSISLISFAILRFIFTYLSLTLGFGTISLGAGFLLAGVISYLLTEILIHIQKKIDVKNHIKKPSTKQNYIKSEEFNDLNLKKIFLGFLKTSLIFFGSALLFMLVPVLVNVIFKEEDADLYSIISFFGQIAFFASSSFLNGVISHAARTKNKQIYYQSLGIISLISFGVVIVVYFFGEYFLMLMGRSRYTDQLDLILLYSIYISFYNIIYLSLQFLSAINSKKLALHVYYFTFLLLGLIMILNSRLIPDIDLTVLNVILVNTFVVILGAGYFIFRLILLKSKYE